jgi:phosphomannomutase
VTDAVYLAAERWIEGDPDPATRSELRRLVQACSREELGERLAGDLAFGTAGLRGLMGAGSARMNRATVIRTSHAVGRYLAERRSDGAVVVGYDSRHQSRVFAEDAAGVLAALGLRVRFFAEPVPTPLVAHAALELGASAAVVITASHNPAEYNGYKLYGEDAIQIVPPADSEIAALLGAAPPARTVPRIEQAFSIGHARVVPLDLGLFDEYLTRLDALRPAVRADRALRIAYTPLHGVGWRYAERALRRAGYQDLHVVTEQAEPDPDFPTAPRPNPEEPGTLDLVRQLGRAVGADLVLINDPDADRLAVCLPRSDGSFGELSGDQIGLLLADFLLAHATRPALVVSTVVSSRMLDSIARAHGARLERTLTGFKWICSAGVEIERRERVRFSFGYEEAYGYAVPLVRDKDGISAAVLFADLAAWCRARGLTVREHLGRLYHRYGLWVSRQRNVVLPGEQGLGRIEAAMLRLAAMPPRMIAGRSVISMVDYRADAEHRPRWLPAATLIELELDGGARVFVRPSGTEPKLKVYVDLRASLGTDEDASACEASVVPEADAISEHLVSWLGLG